MSGRMRKLTKSMKSTLPRAVFALLAVGAFACSGNMQTRSYGAVSTSAPGIDNPDAPYVIHTSAKKTPLYRGDVSADQVKIEVDPKTKTVKIKGKVKLRNPKTKKSKETEVELVGEYDKDGIATLRPVNKSKDPNAIEVRSKVTCLDDDAENDCTQIVADIFVKDPETKTYHVAQIESKSPEAKPKSTPSPKPTLTPTLIPTPTSVPTPSPKETSKEEDESEGYEGVPDLYVGHIYSNFDELFDDSYVADGEKNPSLDDSRPKDQAIRQPDNGALANSTNLKSRIEELISDKSDRNDPYIEIPNDERQRYFGTYELVELVLNMGFMTKHLNLDYKLQVSDLSQKNGGRLVGSEHVSHQNGIDADIGYFSTEFKPSDPFPSVISSRKIKSSFLTKETLLLFKSMILDSKGAVDRIFVNQVVKTGLCKKAVEMGLVTSNYKSGDGVEILRRLRPWAGHDDHFHMRIKCSKYQRKCRQMSEPPAGAGC